jgi:hypothetical protein
MVTASIRSVEPARREAVLQLLATARINYGLQTLGHAYDLKVSFTVDSGGQTKYDGAWQMEDIFDPNRGLRWTAKSSGGYSLTRITSHGTIYGQETESYVPLRLHEARAALFDPIPSAANLKRASIRTSTANFNGTQLTCYFLSPPGKTANSAPGRRWDETEECVDPQTGLLQFHSQVPGRYYTYDYTDAPRLGSRMLPHSVTVSEGDRVVTRISVDSLKELPAVDPNLFVPTDEMRTGGRPVAMGAAQKLFRVAGNGSGASTVCVFGVITPSGELEEAHTLQPSDPNSQAAVEAALKMSFAGLAPLGAHPQQHFVFIVERFGGSR